MRLMVSENSRQFEALFLHASIGIVVTNSTGHVVDMNNYALAQFGYPQKDEIIGQRIEILIPARLYNKHMKHREGFYHHPSPRKMGEGRDLFAVKKDGTEFPVEVSLSYYELEGELFVIGFVIDITVRKKQELTLLEQKTELETITREVTRLNEELEQKVVARTGLLHETLAALEDSRNELTEALKAEKELSELKSRFVTIASHEFRTPLSTILSSAFLAEKFAEKSDAGSIYKHLQRIRGAVSQLKSILEDFLSIGKLEEGLVKAQIEIVSAEDCKAEIQAVIADMEQLLKSGQAIDFTFCGANQVQMDKHFLKNILNNLLSNAIKFSPPGTTIEVQASVSPDELWFSVKDKGIGIGEEEQQYLFKRFFRAENATNIQGTGLGLHIVAKYMELLGGTITCQSKLNEGTCFTICVPQPIKTAL